MFIGPMYAGKTSKLMGLYESSVDTKVILDYDPNYHIGKLKNHDDITMVCIKTPELLNVDITRYNEIYINEGQFFPDLLDFIKMTKGKHIYIAGLDGDFRREKMGYILDVIPLCDTVTKLHSRCICGKDALFSYRTTNDTQQYLPDETCYVPLCRVCYDKKIETNL